MIKFIEKSLIDQNKEENDFYEISLADIFSSFVRNKKTVLLATFFGISISTISALIRVPVFQGEFQIVLDSKRNSRSSDFSDQLSQVVSSGLIKKQADDLKTTTKILESSSVLNPIYTFVKKSKLSKKADDIPKSFKSWKKNVDISLLKGTSVLEVKYKDSDKELISNVLDRISISYQEFSGRDKKNNRLKTINILENQYDQMREKANRSLVKLQNFSLENGLGLEDGLPAMESQNEIEVQIPEIVQNALPNFGGSPTYSNQDNKNRYRSHFRKLRNLESEYLQKSSLLKDESTIMKNLKSQINTLKNSISRPKEILLEYRVLKRDAIRDEQILASLEKQILFYKLTEAQKSDPWELISNPTIPDIPIGISKKIIVLIGTLIGFFSGGIIGFIFDKKSDLIFSLDEFKNILDFNYLISFAIDNLDSSKEILEIIKQNFDITNKENNHLIYCGNKDSENGFFDKLDKFLNKNEIGSIKEYSYIPKAKEIILIVLPGLITKKEINYIKQLIVISKVNVKGWIYLESK